MYLGSIKSFSTAEALCHIISRKPPRSEYAHSHRDEASLEHYVRESEIPPFAIVPAEVRCTDWVPASRHLGIVWLTRRRRQAHVRVLASAQPPPCQLTTPKAYQSLVIQGNLAGTTPLLVVVPQSPSAERSYESYVGSRYELAGWIPDRMRKPFTRRLHHLMDIRTDKNFLQRRSTNFQTGLCLPQSLKGTMRLLS